MTGTDASAPAQVVRSARVAWRDRPPAGGGQITVESRAFGSITMSIPEGATISRHTTPGELLAAAHAGLMATALAAVLQDAGTPATELVVGVHAAFCGPPVERELTAVDLDVHGRVPGLDQRGFEQAAAAARARYLSSCGTRGDLGGKVRAALRG